MKDLKNERGFTLIEMLIVLLRYIHIADYYDS